MTARFLRLRWIAVVVGLLLSSGFLLCACRDEPRSPEASLSVAGALRTSDDRGYAKALAPRDFAFPADHGPHPEFRTEWWYFTGNLDALEGRRFGFQLTFFRSALASGMPRRESAWAARQAWLAHFTVTDVAGGGFHSCERWARGAAGLAGARSEPFRVWVQDWSAAAGGGPVFPLRLRAAADGTGKDGAGIDLSLEQGRAPVLQGDRGLSRKSTEPGNASYYYSLTRMPAAGAVRLGGESFAVTGAAWMDREWSTSALGREQVGWDWFALQLSGGADLMLYQLRRRDGSADPASSGTAVGPQGQTRRLGRGDFRIEALEHWTSPRSGARYPSRWRLRIPAERLTLSVTPVLAGQELDVSFRYWEGAVDVEGTRAGRPVRGRGYVEMTGYTEAR